MSVDEVLQWIPWFTHSADDPPETCQLIRARHFDHPDNWVQVYADGEATGLWSASTFHWPEGFVPTETTPTGRKCIYQLRVINKALEGKKLILHRTDVSQMRKENAWEEMNTLYHLRRELFQNFRRQEDIISIVNRYPVVHPGEVPEHCLRRDSRLYDQFWGKGLTELEFLGQVQLVNPAPENDIGVKTEDTNMEPEAPGPKMESDVTADGEASQMETEEITGESLDEDAKMFSDAVPQVEAGDPPSSAQGEVLLTADHKPDLVDVSVTRNQSDSSDDGGVVDFAEILQESEKKERELPPSFIHQYALGVTRMPTVSAHCIKVRINDGIKEVSVPAYVMIEGVPCPVLDTYAADFSKIIREVKLPN